MHKSVRPIIIMLLMVIFYSSTKAQGSNQFRGDRMRASANAFLVPGQSICSENGMYLLTYQADGNLVIYTSQDHRAIWATATNGRPAWRTVMQGDGNFVIYEGPGRPIWASNTGGYTNTELRMASDGNLTLYDLSNGKTYWASGSNQ